jgi:hypothetical protein
VFPERFGLEAPLPFTVNTPFLLQSLRRLVPWATPIAWSVFCLGCAGDNVAFSPAAVAANSPTAQVVGRVELYPLATKYVAEHPGTDYLVGSGDSMKPLYKDHTVIITEAMPISGLKPGMTVVYLGDSGHPVAHVLVKKTSDGWIAMGIGNPRCDIQSVSEENYIATVVAAYEPRSSSIGP